MAGSSPAFFVMIRYLVVGFVLLSSSVFSQSPSSDRVFTLKPALGINGCQVNGDNYSGYNKVGAFGGLGINARLSAKISLELGFYFTQKGSRHNSKPDKGDLSFYRLHFNYLELPLLFRYQLNSTYFGSIGPSVAYLISSQEENQYGMVTGQPFNKLDFGGFIGLGRKLGSRLLIEVRLYGSFLPIRNYGLFQGQVYYPNPATQIFKPGLYNNVLTFLLAYPISFDKKSGS